MKALVIEDDLIVSDFVCNGLKQAGYTVEQAHDGKTGLHFALSESYDIAIVDLMLPQMDGLTIIDRIRAAKISLPIIILSAKRSVDERINGLRHGGDDYLTKPFSFSELIARIDAVVRRSSAVAEASELCFDNLHMDLLSRKVTRGDRRIELQPKEFALLEYLVRNAGHVVSKTMIMERVWDYHFDPGTNVVEARVSKLREKIDRGSDYPLIQTIRGVGYVLKKPND
jgi:two-component system OmpR family response regulator